MAYAIRKKLELKDLQDISISMRNRTDRCDIYISNEIEINLRKNNEYNIQIVIQHDGSILLDECPWADIGYHELEPVEDIRQIENYIPELLSLVYWRDE